MSTWFCNNAPYTMGLSDIRALIEEARQQGMDEANEANAMAIAPPEASPEQKEEWRLEGLRHERLHWVRVWAGQISAAWAAQGDFDPEQAFYVANVMAEGE